MIRLRIPYVKEDLYKERMVAYIDEIVQNMDRYEDSGERLRYIRVRLSLKNSFPSLWRIWTQCGLAFIRGSGSRNRAGISAMKRRWEAQAVPGIYIQFLVAIINYISNINGANVDNSRIGKVIFIDNPFGAARISIFGNLFLNF